MNGDQSNRRTLLLNGAAMALVMPLAACAYRPPSPSKKPCDYLPATDAWNCPVINLPPLGAETIDTSADHDWAARTLGAAICAYNIPPDESCFDATYWNPIGVKGQAIVIAGGEECIDAAVVAATTDDWVVLSLRGTIGDYTSLHGLFSFIDDWWEDDESRLCPFDPMMGGSPSGDYGKVHYGFQRAMRHLWPKIKAALESPEIDLVNKKGIQITGHSKGAALTFLAAMLVSLHFPNVKKIGVHAFAAPQAGDADFARAYNERKLDKRTTRYQHAHDIVPLLPPYTECLEPEMDWNIFEHLDWRWSPDSVALHELLVAVGDQVQIGYARVGSVKYYSETEHGQSGIAAERNARAAIEYKLKGGHGEEIAAAHSAINSYWPAVCPDCLRSLGCSVES